MITVTTLEKPYLCLVTNGVYQLHADTTSKIGGGDAGFRPHDLLAAALGSCLAITMKKFAAEQKIPVQSISVGVELDKSIPDKTVFCKRISIQGDISEEDRKRLYEAANTCAVQQTLSRQLEFIVE